MAIQYFASSVPPFTWLITKRTIKTKKRSIGTESDILLFESINRQLKEMGYDKVPAFKPLKEEYDFLSARKASLDDIYQAEKQKVNELASAKKNIDRYLAQDKSKVRGKARDELD